MSIEYKRVKGCSVFIPDNKPLPDEWFLEYTIDRVWIDEMQPKEKHFSEVQSPESWK